MPPPPPLPTPTQPSLTSVLAKPKTKGKIHVSFTDWILGGSLLSINSPNPNNVVPAATRQRNDSRIRATATKDKKGRNIVILEDREQDGMVGEVEMLVVRKVSKKNGHGRSRSGSAGEVVSVKAKISEEVLETVVEESKEEKKAESKEELKDEKKEEVVEVKKADGDDKGEHVLNLQKDGDSKEEAVKVVEEKSEESKPKGEELKADVVIEIAVVPSTEDKDKDKTAEPEVVIVEVEVKGKEDKDKGKDKKQDKDVNETSKGEDDPESNTAKPEEPSADTTVTATDSKEKTPSITDKDAEKAPEEPIEIADDKKDEKVEPVKGNEWTKEQDSKLIAMKKENKTWKEISGELGTGKKEVVARYKVLQEQEKTEDEEEKAEVEEKPKKVEKKKKTKCTAQVDNEDTEEEIYISPDCPYHQPKSNASAASAPKQEKKKKRKSYGELEKDRDDEDEEQEERMQGNGHGNHQGHLRPDKIWSAEDCETLEYLMEKHRSTQWLQLQAGFFNYTGRMVKAEFIERKFRKDGLA
ncbi:uncharacterized protein EAE97_000170 [Botrytis byssoidea]|uniref:Myb-like domain-containing protein n=1 Tax=Botrytis byssoidea TaxID=139641 RepID=A0A9P5LZA1_9HELO|nr:uncharacterized protein EAE97_000170 [Botrytis byssoidea]KAF7954911.1 hypothetical protein EAE97_000170 [Botrytis byssoidea]